MKRGGRGEERERVDFWDKEGIGTEGDEGRKGFGVEASWPWRASVQKKLTGGHGGNRGAVGSLFASLPIVGFEGKKQKGTLMGGNLR